MQKDDAASKQPPAQASTDIQLSPCVRRNREMFRYLLTTFQSLLPTEKAAQFDGISKGLDQAIDDNCQACRLQHQTVEESMPRDPRRTRFLLRLVVSRLSHLFTGKAPAMPRSLIEGIDRYLNKAFGQMIYDELNAEADQILYNLNIDDDTQMWEGIRRNPQWRRFVDTIFIRILLRFENFPLGKKTFMNILDFTMEDISRFSFTEEHFYTVFEALFVESWKDLQNPEQRLRWDFLFGDGAAKRLDAILNLGLVFWLKRKDKTVLGSGRVVADKAVIARKK